MSRVSDEMRKRFGAIDMQRDAGLSVPENMARYDDILYGADDEWNRLDVYRLKGQQQPQPVIINIHGGGWVYGTKETYQYYGMDLAGRGFTVVNPTYRLAPENPFPAQLEDINSCVLWTIQHAEEYGIDSGHIFMVGDSAGAHLLSLYMAACINPEFARSLGVSPPNGFVPSAAALNCGCYRPMDEPFVSSYEDTCALMSDLLGKENIRKNRHLINVPEYITDAFPPVFVMTALGDYMKGQQKYLIDALLKRSIPFVMKTYGTKDRALGHVFHLYIREPEAIECINDECEFFQSYLQSRDKRL